MPDEPPKRLLLVSQRPVDYGGGGSVRWEFLRRALPGLGWEVHTVTARANLTANEVSTNASAAKLAAGRARVMAAAGAMLGPATRRFVGIQPEVLAPNGLWAWTGRAQIRRALDSVRPDVVWATTPPVSALFAAAAVLRDRPVPLVGEFRDLWAGNPLFDAGGDALSRLEARALERCAAIVSVTDGCVARLAAMHPALAPRLRMLPNGFDPSLLDRRREAPVAQRARATVLHAGTLYGDRTGVTLLHALSRKELASRIQVQLVGSLDHATIAACGAARTAGLHVEVIAPVSWDRAIDLTAAADIATVINSPGTGGDVALPTKLYEALALGRPLLALTAPDSEAARLLASLGQGAGCAPPDDESAIAAAALRLLDDPPTPVDAAALEPWDRSVVAGQIAALLNNLSRDARPGPSRDRRQSPAEHL
jgi:glycosyltransferase involved in cell wall biosynthesis